MSTAAPRPRPRPAHTSGTTRCAYTPSGARLVTVGSNNTIRLYKTGSDGEPANIDESQEQNVAVAAADDFFIVGSEDGTVSVYSIETLLFERFIIRTSLPVRDVALSPDGKWCAVASDELTVKVVGVEDNSQVKTLKDHGRPAKHVTFDPKGSMLAVSCTDGIVYIYSLTADQPELIHKVDGIIGSLETDSDVSSKAIWHPDGRAFAMPTPTRDIQVVSKNDWEKQRTFSNGHLGDITAIAWSPNGAMLATAGKDAKLIIWETKTQSVIQKHDYSNIIDISWHPTDNLVSFTTLEGSAYICPGLITEQFAGFIKLPKQPAPFIHDPLAEISNLRRPQANGHGAIPERPRRASLGSLDSFLNGGDDDGMEGVDDMDDFVVDDDGAGYTTGNSLKRPHDGLLDVAAKRRQLMQPQYHESFQPGSTPWRGNRKYLCLNLIGFVWTVDQDGHNTVTVEFYDHELHRDFHFTDGDLYDKACLTEHGTLFSSPPQENAPATIAYRPHETWTQRHDWRIQLPKGEAVLAMSLSESFITVTTTANYVRVYSLFGLPYRVYRPKNSPMVTCASWKDYVLTMGNGSVGGDGSTKLVYTIENVKSDVICQNEDTVALPENATLKSVFFSDKGDPCIYDSTGTLLTLLHWRRPSQASWIPLLDTKLLPRLAGGRKTESYYPIAVADNKFHCIILKGGDQYPYFPRPLLSEFDFSVPLTSEPPKLAQEDEDDDAERDGERAGGDAEARKLEQAFLLGTVAAAQLRDAAADELHAPEGGRHASRSALARMELEVDKTLLQLLAAECREGEERGMRALEMVQLMRDRTGRMVEAAVKSKQYLTTHTVDNAHIADIFAVATTPRALLSGSGSSTIHVHDTTDQTYPIIQSISGAHKLGCHHISTSRNGAIAASAGFGGEVKVWAVTKETGEWKLHTQVKQAANAGEVWAIALSEDGRFLAGTTLDGRINVWDVSGAEPAKIQEYETGSGGAGSFGISVDLSRDGRLTASGHHSGAVYVFNNETGRLLYSLAGLAKPVRTVSFSPGSSRLAAAGDASVIALYDMKHGEHVGNLTGHASWITSVDWSDTGEYLLSGAMDGKVKVWSVDRSACVATHSETDKPLWSVKWLPKTVRSEMFCTGGANRSLTFYREATGI
ncbi:WD40-repeat-containing domain protein [Plectosphaerella cucumerina]|uniref:WD40-repeat-containing domain protein n=1 Tax=Plectosphaerella cucumerina TaxID=40658 RepID=A0A8K0T6P7_9PEZI|nr:WD40-repeat-containing domain protein [Plectosphaerella cucumerina]